VFRIDSYLNIRLFAGNGDIGTGAPLQDGEGTSALTAALGGCDGLAIGSDDSLYVAEHNFATIRRITPSGRMETVAGTWGQPSTGTTLRTTSLVSPTSVAIGPNGDIFIGQGGVEPILRSRILASDAVFEADGSLRYAFDEAGRHVTTIDPTTGRLHAALGYDARGWLTSITDGDGRITTIERDTNTGAPLAVIGPFGHRTVLHTDAAGRLDTVTDPSGAAVSMTYTPGQLLETFTSGRHFTSSFTYDAAGRLLTDTDAAHGVRMLEKLSSTVTRFTSAAGRVHTIAHWVDQLGSRHSTVTEADGTVSSTEENADVEKVTLADGTTVTESLADDPRFGARSRYIRKLVTSVPGLDPVTIENQRVIEGYTGGTLDYTRWAETSTTNGSNPSTTEYRPATRTWTMTSAEGRVKRVVLDSKGRIAAIKAAGYPDIVPTYDALGRIETISEKGRLTRYEYGVAGKGRPTALIDALSHRHELTYDANGRLHTLTAADGGLLVLEHDENGNVSSVTPPGRGAHTLDHSVLDDLVAAHTPMVNGVSTVEIINRDADGAPDLVHEADGTTRDFRYDTYGRLQSVVAPEGTTSLAYDSTSGLVSGLDSTTDVDVGFTYYGRLLRKLTWTGVINGSVERSYDSVLAVGSVAVNGTSVTYNHDRDGYPTGAGAMVVGRSPTSGRTTGSTLGNVVDAYAYDPSSGDLSSYGATVAGSMAYHVDYTYDAVGRIDSRVETIAGVTKVFEYEYDLVGRLAWVYVDGVVRSHYTYDTNGNRQSAVLGSVTEVGSPDMRDRLQSYGGRTFTYDPLGNVSTIVSGSQTTGYVFDSSSKLRSVTLPDGRVIRYVIDALGRRVGRKLQPAGSSTATLTQGFLYLDDTRPVAELDASGQVVSTFVYASARHVPDYLVKGGKTYRLVVDQVGSPRLVIDTTSGAIVQRMDFDEFGRVLSDSAPGFQPFGFAGGLYDRDTKLVHFGAREYDAFAGRWMSPDPIRFSGGDANLYAYVANDPINWIDPTGHDGQACSDVNARMDELAAAVKDVARTRKALDSAINNMKAGEWAMGGAAGAVVIACIPGVNIVAAAVAVGVAVAGAVSGSYWTVSAAQAAQLAAADYDHALDRAINAADALDSCLDGDQDTCTGP
jgi:RHS repeat-associated protein